MLSDIIIQFISKYDNCKYYNNENRKDYRIKKGVDAYYYIISCLIKVID